MSANTFGNRFYGLRDAAWHKLGIVSQIEQCGVEALTAIGGGHVVEKYPNFALINGEYVPTNDFVLMRWPTPDDNQYRKFGHVEDRYAVLSSLEAVELFDQKVGKPVETLGFLGNGERMFLTWELPTIEVVKDDVVKLYAFLALGFDSLMGTILATTTTRVVCENTWRAALSEAQYSGKKNVGVAFSGKHTQKNLKFALGEWMEHVQKRAEKEVGLVESFFKKLAATPLKSDEEVYKLLFQAYPNQDPFNKDVPDSLRQIEIDKVEDKNEKAQKNRDGIYALFSGAGTAITPDYWGLFNATTEWFNYGQSSKKAVEYSILLGNRAADMNRMAEVLKYQLSK